MRDWFPHDYAASRDDKMLQLIARRGIGAYGLYWLIVEVLYEFGGSCVRDVLQLRLRLVADGNQLRMSSVQIATMIELGLLVEADGTISSERVIAELAEKKARSKKASLNAKERWGNHANAMRPHSDGNALTIHNNTVQDSKEREEQPLSPRAEIRRLTADEIEDVKDKKANAKKPTYEQLAAYSELRGIKSELYDVFWNQCEGRGWRAGENNHPIAKWQNYLELWVLREKGKSP